MHTLKQLGYSTLQAYSLVCGHGVAAKLLFWRAKNEHRRKEAFGHSSGIGYSTVLLKGT